MTVSLDALEMSDGDTRNWRQVSNSARSSETVGPMPAHSGSNSLSDERFSSMIDLIISSASSTPMDISLKQQSSKMLLASSSSVQIGSPSSTSPRFSIRSTFCRQAALDGNTIMPPNGSSSRVWWSCSSISSMIT